MSEAKIRKGNMEISISGDGSSITIQNLFMPTIDINNLVRNPQLREILMDFFNTVVDQLLEIVGINKKKFLQMQLDLLEKSIMTQKAMAKVLAKNSPVLLLYMIYIKEKWPM